MFHPSSLRPIELSGSNLHFVVDNIGNSEIRQSTIHGYGLFATQCVAEGDELAVLDGQVVTWASFDAFRQAKLYGQDGDDLCMEWNALSVDVLLVRPFRTKYSFINHSRTPSLRLENRPLRLIAVRAITAGEEFTLDYRCEPLKDSYLQEAKYL